MSTQTQAAIFSAWGNAVATLDRLRRFGKSGGYPAGDSDNLTGRINTLQTSYVGDFLDDEEDAIEALRAGVAQTLTPAAIAAVHRPWLKQYCKDVIGRSDLQSDGEMWNELYRYFQANNIYVQSRVITYGAPSGAGANSGNGQILRLTRDKYNFPIESGYIDSKRALCVADENSGTLRGQEVFEIKGQASARDELERSGSGLRGTIAGRIIGDSIVNNPGFRSFGGTAGSDAPTSLTSWTSTDLTGASLAYNSTNYGIDQTNYFRTFNGDATPGSLVMKVSSRISQKLRNARTTSLSADVPYMKAVIWNRAVNSASGTLNLRMGNITTTVAVSGQTGWTVTTVPSNIPNGQSCWYRQFAQADLQFQIEWVQTGGTGLLISEVLVCPGTSFDGTWYWAIPASTATYAQHRVLDSFTWPDSASGSAKNQSFIARGFPGIYVPSSNGSSITFSEVS